MITRTIEVANISLESAAGAELLSNGSFSAGMDRWFFSTDVDPPWHIHSLPVTILFEQGWLGLIAWTLALVVATVSATVRTWHRSPVAASVLAALLAMVVSGMTNTLIDAPRFLTMLLALLWMASLSDDRASGSPPCTNP